MGKYTFEAIDANGKKSTGKLDADNEKEVRKLLRAQGLRVKKIIAPTILEFDFGQWMIDKGIASSVDPRALMMFTNQLATLLSAGVPILQSLDFVPIRKKSSLKN